MRDSPELDEALKAMINTFVELVSNGYLLLGYNYDENKILLFHHKQLCHAEFYLNTITSDDVNLVSVDGKQTYNLPGPRTSPSKN